MKVFLQQNLGLSTIYVSVQIQTCRCKLDHDKAQQDRTLSVSNHHNMRERERERERERVSTCTMTSTWCKITMAPKRKRHTGTPRLVTCTPSTRAGQNKDQASSTFRELKHQSVLLQLQTLKLPKENLWKNVPGTYRQEKLSKNKTKKVSPISQRLSPP